VGLGEQVAQSSPDSVELAVQPQDVDLFGFAQELAGGLARGGVGGFEAGGKEGYPHLVDGFVAACGAG
jgi:hypothetical protein